MNHERENGGVVQTFDRKGQDRLGARRETPPIFSSGSGDQNR